MNQLMSELLCRVEEARRYASGIGDRIERVWTEYALSHAIGTLVREPTTEEASSPSTSMDLLTYVRLSHAAFRDQELVAQILSGKYKNFADIPDRF